MSNLFQIVDATLRRAAISACVVMASVIAVSFAGASGAAADSFTDRTTGNGVLSKFAGAERVSVQVKSSGSKSTASNGYFASSKQASKSKSKGTKVASLGGGYYAPPKPKTSLSGGGNVKWVANAGCLSGSLKSVIYAVAANYGPVTVTSTCRSHAHNKRVGGAPKSYHLTGNAADFRVHGNASAAAAFVRSQVGGFKSYGGGLFHIDTGPRRPMG